MVRTTSHTSVFVPEHAGLAGLVGERDTDENLTSHTVRMLDSKDGWVRYIFRPLDARDPIVIYGWPGPVAASDG